MTRKIDDDIFIRGDDDIEESFIDESSSFEILFDNLIMNVTEFIATSYNIIKKIIKDATKHE